MTNGHGCRRSALQNVQRRSAQQPYSEQPLRSVPSPYKHGRPTIKRRTCVRNSGEFEAYIKETDNFAALKACEPGLPPTAFNRLADNWRPLFAIAQIAGAPWPELALASFNKLTNPLLTEGKSRSEIGISLPPLFQVQGSAVQSSTVQGSSANSDLTNSNFTDCPGSQLLADIRQIFTQSNASRLSSAQIVRALCALPDRTYAQRWSISSEPRRLAGILRPFGINPRTLRFDGRLAKGYLLADLPTPTEPRP